MPSLRLFIALTLPEGILTELESLQNGLPDTRWTAAEQMHLTLKFLGDVEESSVEPLVEAFQERRQDFSAALRLRIQGVGYFGQKKVPPVIWAGIEPEEPARELHGVVESMASSLGFPKEKRPFRPHITLGRMKRHHSRRLQEYLELHHAYSSLYFQCPEAVLFSSRLLPHGAVHEPVSVIPSHPPS